MVDNMASMTWKSIAGIVFLIICSSMVFAQSADDVVLDPSASTVLQVPGNALINGELDLNGNSLFNLQSLESDLDVNTDDDSALTLDKADSSWNYVEFLHEGTRQAWLGLNDADDFQLHKEDGGDIALTGTNVGIGLNNPINMLDVAGSTRIRGQTFHRDSLDINIGSDTLPKKLVRFVNDAGEQGYIETRPGIRFGSGASAPLSLWQSVSQPIHLGTNDAIRMTIASNGNIGIGTSPGQRLDVSGGAVRVTDTGNSIHTNAGGLLIGRSAGDFGGGSQYGLDAGDPMIQLATGSHNGGASRLILGIDRSGNTGVIAAPHSQSGLRFGIKHSNGVPETALTINSAGNLNVHGNRITSLASPSSASDAATKQYVDDNAGGIDCPSGFTEVSSSGRTLGCIQNSEEGTATYTSASDTCFSSYGGRLPTMQEWYVSMSNYNLQDETDDYEATASVGYYDTDGSNGVDSDIYIRVGSGSLTEMTIGYVHDFHDGSATDAAYRCWIPN